RRDARGVDAVLVAAPALRIEQPMRAARPVAVEILAVIAAHAFGDDDLAVPDRAPLARVLAHLALTALRPPLDAERGQHRQQPERGADRTEEAAIKVADEHACDEQRGEPDPQHGGRLEREHPERLDVSIERDLAAQQKVADRAREDAVLD